MTEQDKPDGKSKRYGYLGCLLVAWAALVLSPVVSRYVQRMGLPEEWMKANLAWTDMIGSDGFPILSYTRIAARPTHGARDTWLEVLHGDVPVRTCGSTGLHGYLPTDIKPILIEVAMIVQDPDCRQPSSPFRVCVQWRLSEGDISVITPTTCSDYYRKPLVVPPVPLPARADTTKTHTGGQSDEW